MSYVGRRIKAVVKGSPDPAPTLKEEAASDLAIGPAAGGGEGGASYAPPSVKAAPYASVGTKDEGMPITQGHAPQ